MVSAISSLDGLMPWMSINGVRLNGVRLHDFGNHRGHGVIATDPILAQSPDSTATGALISIPSSLVLDEEHVEVHAKVDRNFGDLLKTYNGMTPRLAILIYLVVQKTKASSSTRCRAVLSSPWTSYVGFLPKNVPVPTLWTAEELKLLRGTTLHAAVEAKFEALNGEFRELESAVSSLPFWSDVFQDENALSFEDWLLVDGWFRSRSLELPGHGVAMVPVIDMLNHSKSPNAYFDSIRGSGADGSVVIHLMPEAGTVQPNDEITISYGATKSIAEMVFSYGFVPVSSSLSDTDQVVPAATAKVPLEPMEDDPLAKAKAYVLPTPPLVDLRLEKDESDSDDGGGSPQWRASWSSPWAWLACLNEEDGLHFRVARSVETSGDADSTLVLNWDDDDVTSRAAEMESIVAGHELEKVFRLRVVTVVKQGLVSILDDGAEALSQNGPPVGPCRQSCVDAALAVLRSERLLFELAREELAHEEGKLYEDPVVVDYLGLGEQPTMEILVPDADEEAEANDERDQFS